MTPQFRNVLKLAAVAAAVATSACAAWADQKDPPQTFTVLQPNVTLRWSASSSNHFEKADDSSYIIRADGNKWYRAQLTENCAKGVWKYDPITIDFSGFTQIDKFTQLILENGKRCRIQQLDRIEAPAKGK